MCYINNSYLIIRMFETGITGGALSTESYCPNESWIYRATYVQPEPSDCYTYSVLRT